jgi:PDZ domain-containing protein
MKTNLKLHIPTCALFAALSITSQTAFAKDPPLQSLTMEHFRDTATVQDDPHGGTTTITTEKGFVRHSGLLRQVSDDEFLRGVIDNKTGQKSFQVYVWISYNGRWRTYQTANFQAVDGPRSVPATQVSRDVGDCAAGNCLYTEHVAFAVDEPMLRRIAAGYVPGHPPIWSFTLVAKTGVEYSGGLSSAEIAGFLAKVDELTGAVPAAAATAPAALPAAAPAPPPPPVAAAINAAPPAAPAPAAPPPAVKANVPSAPLKPDFGIAGIAVAATVTQPYRAGLLISGVTSDSIAEHSGIIVGDIVYEFDGHPIKTPADLKAAVAACPANSAVAIKLYRGTTATVVTAQF